MGEDMGEAEKEDDIGETEKEEDMGEVEKEEDMGEAEKEEDIAEVVAEVLNDGASSVAGEVIESAVENEGQSLKLEDFADVAGIAAIGEQKCISSCKSRFLDFIDRVNN